VVVIIEGSSRSVKLSETRDNPSGSRPLPSSTARFVQRGRKVFAEEIMFVVYKQV